MARPVEDIAHDLMTCTRPGVDGCCNVDRIAYISEVFEVDTIRLSEKMDYSGVFHCKDASMVNASRHMALLQLDFLNRCFDHYHLEKDEWENKSASLILDIQKMGWHLQHLASGQPTPPFPFIH